MSYYRPYREYLLFYLFFFFQAEDGIRDKLVTGVQTCALPISRNCVASRARISASRGCCHCRRVVAESSTAADGEFHGQTSWQTSQPKIHGPRPARSAGGIGPRCSIVRYEMQRRASSRRPSLSACVGHSVRHAVHRPQWLPDGSSGTRARSVSSSARKNQEPWRVLSSMVFLPNQPRPPR